MALQASDHMVDFGIFMNHRHSLRCLSPFTRCRTRPSQVHGQFRSRTLPLYRVGIVVLLGAEPTASVGIHHELCEYLHPSKTNKKFFQNKKLCAHSFRITPPSRYTLFKFGQSGFSSYPISDRRLSLKTTMDFAPFWYTCLSRVGR